MVNDIDGLTALLKKAGLDMGAEEIADTLWLAGFISSRLDKPQISKEKEQKDEAVIPTTQEQPLDVESEDTQFPVLLSQKQSSQSNVTAVSDFIPLKVPAAPALRIRLSLARALRYLRRQVPSPVKGAFDEAATIERIADQGIWLPVLSPAPEQWLEIALVVEESKSAPLWKETLAEFQTLLERQGAFRGVSSWRLRSYETGKLTLLFGRSNRSRSARELLDPAERRLILLVSDCTSVAWQQGTIYPWLKTWGEQAPMTVIQLLPERLWAYTGLVHGVPMCLRALEPGVPSERMIATAQMPLWNFFGAEEKNQVTVPVVSLEAGPLKQWAKVVAGIGDSQTVGFRFEKKEELEIRNQDIGNQPKLSATEQVRLFRMTASLTAQKLAGLMAAAPVSPPIVNLIRQTMLPEAEPIHVAEVYMGGLMEAQADGEYDFLPEIRKKLLDATLVSDTERVLDKVSKYISKRIGRGNYSFEALLIRDIESDVQDNDMRSNFARISLQVLNQMGGEYADIAARVEKKLKLSSSVHDAKSVTKAAKIKESKTEHISTLQAHEQKAELQPATKTIYKNTDGGGLFSKTGEFFANRPATQAEREVYSYIRSLAQLEDSEKAITAFYSLFFQGNVTSTEFDSAGSVRTALMTILDSPEADEILPYIINRCFYTISNPWRMETRRHEDLRALIARATHLPEHQPNNRKIRRLVKAMQDYVNNETLYVPLQRQMRLLENGENKILLQQQIRLSENKKEEIVTFGDCFKDYFFIYESIAATSDIPVRQRKGIQLQRQKKAQQLSQQLDDYWQACRQGIPREATNPTRLEHKQLQEAISLFHPQRQDGYLYQARHFEQTLADIQTMGEFVEPFYEYIMEPLIQIDDRYQSNRFSKLVKDVLISSAGLSQTPVTGISINQICTRLLKLFVSNSIERPEIAHFKRLVKTVGAKVVTAILLKIVLFRRTIRSYFEDRLAILFYMYENRELDEDPWLIEFFDCMNIALALNASWLNYISGFKPKRK